jgi:sugar phosphate isomerase/epimerase
MEAGQIGLACWGLRKLPLDRQLALCGRLGVKRMELGIANGDTDLPLDTTDAQAAAVRRQCAQAGIRLDAAATGCDFTQADGAAVVADVQKIGRAVRLCGQLGIPWLRVFAGFSPAAEVAGPRWDRMIEALCRCAGAAEKSGTRLAVETHGGVAASGRGVRHFSSVTTQRECLSRLLRELPPEIGFVLDPANLCAAERTDPLEAYSLLKGRIAYLHAKGFAADACGDLHPAACGTGLPDWEAFFAGAADYAGPVLIEYEIPEDVEQGMAQSIRCMSQLCTSNRKEAGHL